MTFKYIGEAVVLVGIAYSIVRWIARNADTSDARAHVMLDVGLTRLGGARDRSNATAAEAGRHSTPSHSSEMLEEVAEPAAPADPGMLDGAAAMFGITRDELVRMEPRQRALLLSGYRAAQGARRRAPRNDQP